jgi:hypothetical protein
MSTTTAQPATTPIPVQLSAHEFTAFILPHLSMPKRGPKCKLGYYRVFNLILWVLWQLPENLSRKGFVPIRGLPRRVTEDVHIFVVVYCWRPSDADPQTALSR